MFDVEKIRQDFPILTKTRVHDKGLVYFDNAATTLKPKSVVEAIADHYLYQASNIHRGVHFLSEQATTAYEAVREKVRHFIGASDKAEIIFTRGTTESINIVALSYGRKFLKTGDEILISTMEHHSNIVPWQILCEEKGCVLKVIPINDDGEIIFEEFEKLLSSKTKLLSMVAISNSLGTVNPIKKMIEAAHHYNVPVLIDGAQAVAHHAVNVTELDCEFFAFSSHKIFGPTGLGILYGKAEFLNKMPPVFGGGDMIDTVTFAKTTYTVIPHKFEAGTPHIAGVMGLGAALDYVKVVGLTAVSQHEQEILHYATTEIKKIPGIRLIGTAKEKGAILAFVMEGAHAHDIGTLVDMDGVAIRTGHHCTQPLMKRFGVSATARASFSVYNTKEEVDVFINALKKVRKMFL